MKVETYACDECKTQRKAANHWFKGFLVPDGVIVLRWEGEIKAANTGDRILSEPDAHLCGASCVTEWLSKNLL